MAVTTYMMSWSIFWTKNINHKKWISMFSSENSQWMYPSSYYTVFNSCIKTARIYQSYPKGYLITVFFDSWFEKYFTKLFLHNSAILNMFCNFYLVKENEIKAIYIKRRFQTRIISRFTVFISLKIANFLFLLTVYEEI